MTYPEELKPERFKKLDIDHHGKYYRFKGVPLDVPIFLKKFINDKLVDICLCQFVKTDEEGNLIFDTKRFEGDVKLTIPQDEFPEHEIKSESVTLKQILTDDNMYR